MLLTFLQLIASTHSSLQPPAWHEVVKLPCAPTHRALVMWPDRMSFLQVFEGEHLYVCDNHPLGTFQLPNIAPGPAGSANILVTMRVGEDGVLQATAFDEDSGGVQAEAIMSPAHEALKQLCRLLMKHCAFCTHC